MLFKIAKKSLNISATFVWQLVIQNFLKMTNLVTLEEPDVEVVVKVVHISWRLIHLLTNVWSLNIGDPLPSPRYFLNCCTTTAKSNNNDITILGFVKKLSIVGTDIHFLLNMFIDHHTVKITLFNTWENLYYTIILMYSQIK